MVNEDWELIARNVQHKSELKIGDRVECRNIGGEVVWEVVGMNDDSDTVFHSNVRAIDTVKGSYGLIAPEDICKVWRKKLLSSDYVKMRYKNMIGYFRVETINNFEITESEFMLLAQVVLGAKSGEVLKQRVCDEDVFDKFFGVEDKQ